MTTGGSGGATLPDLSFGVGAGQMDDLAARTKASIESQLKAAKKPVIEAGFGDFNGGLIGVLQRVFTGTPGGLLAAGLATLRDLFSLRWAQADAHEVQITDLQDRSQILEGIIGYGQWYSDKSPQFSGTRLVAFNRVLGPVVGCSNSGTGVVTLNSRGLWRCEAQVQMSIAVGGDNDVTGIIIVRNPSGDVFASRRATIRPPNVVFNAGTAMATIYVALPFVVPDSGYTVEVRVESSGPRYVYGGAVYNGMTVNKVSSELGPGMRLQTPYSATSSYTTIGPMAATGGGSVNANRAVAGGGITAGRVDATVIASGTCDVRLMRGTSVLATSTGKSAHSLVWSGSVTSGDLFHLEVQGAGVTVSASNSTYMTIMNTDQLSSDTSEP